MLRRMETIARTYNARLAGVHDRTPDDTRHRGGAGHSRIHCDRCAAEWVW